MSAYLAYSYSTGIDIKKCQKKSSSRSFKRYFKKRFRRLIKKPKFLKAKQEIVKFQKFSMICMVGNPAISQDLPISKEEGLVKLFWTMLGQAWDLFIKLGGLMIEWSKNCSVSLIKLIIKHKFFLGFATFASCALLLFNHLATKFGRKLKWYDRLITFILILLALLLLYIIIKVEALQTIVNWLKSILIQLILILHKLTSLIESHTHTQKIVEIKKPKPSKTREFEMFIFFSFITAITTGYLLSLFKRKVVGDGPFSDIIVQIIEIDLNDYLFKKTKK